MPQLPPFFHVTARAVAQAAAQASDDFRLCLPVAAGGLQAAHNHILYDRDSESEADSDEDPDDDIDI